MKIGIVTFHRADNFGAMLQAVALRQKLSDLGHEVFFVDYWPDDHKAFYNPRRIINSLFKHPISFVHEIVKKVCVYPIAVKRKKRFTDFANKYILPYLTTTAESLDAVIYGSDQIWARFSFLNGGKFDRFYFADNEIRSARHISYAASMGSTKVDDDERRFLASVLKKFEKISVREADMIPLIKETSGLQAELVCDPTLLLPSAEWRKLLNVKNIINEPYALFYEMQLGCFDRSAMRQFCKERSLKLITITAFLSLNTLVSDELGVVGPEEFISLIANADFVFTSSFHGLAFSIIFERQFLCSYKGKGERAKTLLNAVGLESRMLPVRARFKAGEIKNIDYTSIGSKMDDYRKSSLKFLQTI